MGLFCNRGRPRRHPSHTNIISKRQKRADYKTEMLPQLGAFYVHSLPCHKLSFKKRKTYHDSINISNGHGSDLTVNPESLFTLTGASQWLGIDCIWDCIVINQHNLQTSLN